MLVAAHPIADADVRPPRVVVTAHARHTARGWIFAAPKRGPRGDQDGPMIFDNRGRAVWFKPIPGKKAAYSFRAQRYHGRPVLTWWQGIPHDGYGTGVGEIYDDHYRHVATVRAGHGLSMDLHEFQLTGRGTALILAYVPQRRDLRRWGGHADGLVLDQAVQEVDVRTGRVLLDWRALRHISPGESYMRPPHNRRKFWDPLHLNSIEVDTDGNLLLSARDSSATYKIDRRTGRVIWRMGGRRSDFRMGPGTRVAWQHDARRLPNGHLTWFDNNAVRPTSARIHSRGVEAAVTGRRVRLVRQWRHAPRELSTSQANVQTLPNGNVFIGWGGGQPNMTEYSRSGRRLFEARFAGAGTDSYRAYRLPWTGRPLDRPLVRAGPAGRRLLARWNGATRVVRWRLLAGPSAGALAVVSAHRRTGFDTALALPPGTAAAAAEALDARGRVLGRSRTVAVGG